MKEGSCPITKTNVYNFGNHWKRTVREKTSLGNKEYNVAIKKQWERSF